MISLIAPYLRSRNMQIHVAAILIFALLLGAFTWGTFWFVCLLITVCVWYCMRFLAKIDEIALSFPHPLSQRQRIFHRASTIVAVLGVFAAATFMVVIFWMLLYLATELLGCQCIKGIVHVWNDTAYFSIVTVTTLGYGDLQPDGICRAFGTGQALTGFLGLPVLAGLILHAITRPFPEQLDK